MTSTLKLYGGIALLLILILVGWGIKNWDNNRLETSFKSGEQTERGKWEAASNKAKAEAIEKANSDTLASEAAADQARSNATAVTAASAAANKTTVEKISYAYQNAPPAPCRSDTLPLPVGVLEGLSEARSAALGQAVTAQSGLQPTKLK